MGGRKVPHACSGTFQVDRSKTGVVTLADQCSPHVDMKKEFFTFAGSPMVEINIGKGKLIASEMMLSTRDKDPIAGRLLKNTLTYLAQK